MDPETPHYEDQYSAMDERHLQQVGQHYREGTHHLEIENFQRRQPVNLTVMTV